MVAHPQAEGKAGGYARMLRQAREQLMAMIKLSGGPSFRGAPLGASPESISPRYLLHDGFSDAQLRTMARALRAPE
ncbi:hypothetical protein ACSHT2_23170 [Bradyrhizobium sp. PUT101]|uniref:hypothetical protein n=1 Tax=Bradyrhizobium sp. PUT101 TaxID=3447427 RepID=UPI003F833C3A